MTQRRSALTSLLSSTLAPHVAASSKSGAGVAVVIGCLVVVALGLVALVAAGVVAFFILQPNDGSGGGSSPLDVFSEKDGEVIVYDEVKDAKKGPSVIAPSGKSGDELTKRHGVIHTSSKEIHMGADISYPANPKYCKGTERLTDLPKSLFFDFDRELRKSTRLSQKEEEKLGEEIAAAVRKSAPFRDKLDTPETLAWRKYLARIAQPLLAEIKRKDITYHFHVVDEPVVNAFAMPGGHIYFYTGLLENTNGTWVENEAQVAAIMAHEISHVDLGHTTAIFQYLKRAGLLGNGAENLAGAALYYARHPFSSNQEAESDENGVRIGYMAQYSPKEAVNLWKLWARQREPKREATKGGGSDNAGDILTRELENLLSSHPPAKRRACAIMQHTNDLIAKDRFDRFYVGTTNLSQRTPRIEEQH